jgi:A/G-specific adenine glycosylase
MKSFPWQILLDWYSIHGRHDFPWRQYADSDTTGYRVWLAEILLQQTQADRVVPFYERILSKYPTIEQLADASYDEFFPYYQ